MTAAKRSGKKADPTAGDPRSIRRRWRDYRTPSGRRPVGEFVDELSDSDAAAVLAGMEEVRDRGLRAARHLDGDIWEVRVDGDRVIYRILFAEEGRRGQILLALGPQQEDAEDAATHDRAREEAPGRLATAGRSGPGCARQASAAPMTGAILSPERDTIAGIDVHPRGHPQS